MENNKIENIVNNLKFTSFEETMNMVENKVGKRPKKPSELKGGIWSNQAMQVLKERYLIKNANGGVVETPDEMCWRVSWDIASADCLWGSTKNEVLLTAKEFYKLLVSHEFLPNSPTLMNAGTGNGLQYSACFVIPVEDSLVGIFDAIKYQALIHQTGGGTGFSFSSLRSKGSLVKTSKGTASGPVSFMRVFDAATNEIKQGGKRRGANMGILRVDHPDILEFIQCKEKGGITNFNISVAITDKFIQAFEDDLEYELVDPKSKKVTGRLVAREVFEKIAECAWRTGDPGIIFIDRINRSSANPVPKLGPVESTNPCGEQPLYPYDSCNLGSIFLNNFVENKKGKNAVDWNKLKRIARIGVHFLDNVIEMNPYPLTEIRRTSLAIRRVGLGVGGWADMLIELGIPYDSEGALEMAGRVMKVIQREAIKESEMLARKRGAFPLWEESIYNGQKRRRNSTVTTIAPTGSISIIADASSGIEPLFALAYQHVVKDKLLERTLNFVNPKFIESAKSRGIWRDELEKEVAEKGFIRDIDNIPGDIKSVFGTAHEIHHDWHIKHQAVFQKYTENAVSKTINMKKDVGVKDIKDAYLLAWKTDCKGITVFRDGCKGKQVLNMGIKGEQEAKKNGYLDLREDGEPLVERPLVIKGATYRLKTPVGTAFITINENNVREPLEVFITVGKAGSDIAAMADALGRTISTALRFKGYLRPIDRAREVASQLAGIGGRRSVGFGPNKILSLPDAVGAALSWHYGFKVNGFLKNDINLIPSPNGKLDNSITGGILQTSEFDGLENVNSEIATLETSTLPYPNAPTAELDETISRSNDELLSGLADICPQCGASALVYEEGCSKCHVCGYSEC